MISGGFQPPVSDGELGLTAPDGGVGVREGGAKADFGPLFPRCRGFNRPEVVFSTILA